MPQSTSSCAMRGIGASMPACGGIETGLKRTVLSSSSPASSSSSPLSHLSLLLASLALFSPLTFLVSAVTAPLEIWDDPFASTSHVLTLHTGPYAAQSNPVYGPMMGYEVAGSSIEAMTINATGVADGDTITPTLLSDGLSRHDIRSISCWSATKCVAVGGGDYTSTDGSVGNPQYGQGAAILTSDGGVTWRVAKNCAGGQTDSWALYAAVWHSATVLSVYGKSLICYSNDGGTTWFLQPMYYPGASTYLMNDAGAMHLFRSLDGSGYIIIHYYQFRPSNAASSDNIALFTTTLDPATNTLGAVVTEWSSTEKASCQYFHYPTENSTGLGFYTLGNSYKTYVTLNGGASVAYTGQVNLNRPACPQGTDGTCYALQDGCTSGNDLVVLKAVSPFTNWTSMSVTMPQAAAFTTYSIPWSCMNIGLRPMVCTRVNSQDACVVGVHVAGEVTFGAHILYTSNGWADGSVTATPLAPTVTVHPNSWAGFPSVIDTGPSTAATRFMIGGGRGTILSMSLDGTTLSRLSPPLPRSAPVALVNFNGSSSLFAASGYTVSVSSGGAAAALASTSFNNMWTTSGLSAYTQGEVTAFAALTPTSFIAAVSTPAISAQIYRVGGIANELFYSGDAGVTWTKSCTISTAGTTSSPMAPTLGVKLEHRRPATSADPVPVPDVYIVHPFNITKWSGDLGVTSCGTTVHSIALVDTTSAPIDYPMAVAIGCWPDTTRGCVIIEFTQTAWNGPGYFLRDNTASKMRLLADCGSGNFSTEKVAITWDYSMDWFLPTTFTSDVVIGSSAAAVAFTGFAPNVLFTTSSGGVTWEQCNLTSTACVSPAIPDGSVVTSAVFVSPTVAYAWVTVTDKMSTLPPTLLRLTFSYSSGAGSVAVARMSVSGNTVSLFNKALYYIGTQLVSNPRYFPTTETTATACAALPNNYNPATPAVVSPTPSPSPPPIVSASVSPSPTASVTPTISVTPSTSPTVGAAPSASSSTSPSTAASSSTSSSPSPSPAPATYLLLRILLVGGSPDLLVTDAGGVGSRLRASIASALNVTGSRVVLASVKTAYAAVAGGAIVRNVTIALTLGGTSNAAAAEASVPGGGHDSRCAVAAGELVNGTAVHGEFPLMTTVNVVADLTGVPAGVNGTSAVEVAVASFSAALSTEPSAETALGWFARTIWGPCAGLNTTGPLRDLVVLDGPPPTPFEAVSLSGALEAASDAPPTVTPSGDGDDGLGGGGVAGIIIAALVLLACCFWAALVMRRRREKNDEQNVLEVAAADGKKIVAGSSAALFDAANPMVVRVSEPRAGPRLNVRSYAVSVTVEDKAGAGGRLEAKPEAV